MDLSPSQRVALANLSRKKAGHDVDWISIADARALTEVGLAIRNAGGWQITEDGEAALAISNPVDDGSNEVTNLPGVG